MNRLQLLIDGELKRIFKIACGNKSMSHVVGELIAAYCRRSKDPRVIKLMNERERKLNREYNVTI